MYTRCCGVVTWPILHRAIGPIANSHRFECKVLTSGSTIYCIDIRICAVGMNIQRIKNTGFAMQEVRLIIAHPYGIAMKNYSVHIDSIIFSFFLGVLTWKTLRNKGLIESSWFFAATRFSEAFSIAFAIIRKKHRENSLLHYIVLKQKTSSFDNVLYILLASNTIFRIFFQPFEDFPNISKFFDDFSNFWTIFLIFLILL